jgi:hypothetical protein
VRHSLVIDEYPVLIPKRANVLKDIFQKAGTGWGRHLSQPGRAAAIGGFSCDAISLANRCPSCGKSLQPARFKEQMAFGPIKEAGQGLSIFGKGRVYSMAFAPPSD